MPKGIHLDARPEGDDEIILGIDVSGHYFLNGRPIPKETLEDQLKSIYSARTTDKILYFKADNQRSSRKSRRRWRSPERPAPA